MSLQLPLNLKPKIRGKATVIRKADKTKSKTVTPSNDNKDEANMFSDDGEED